MMKRVALTIPILVLGAWGYTELRPASASATDAAAIAAEDTSRVVMRRVWKLPPEIYYGFIGDVASDGSYVTYRDGSLTLLDLRSRKIVPLPTDEALKAYVVPAPDGRQLAYGTQEGLSVRLIDDPEARTVYRDTGLGYAVPWAWSPDAATVIVTLQRQNDDHAVIQTSLAVIRIDDGSVRVLKSFAWGYPAEVQVSPDGRYIAYSIAPDSGAARDIFVIAADGSRESTVAQHPAEDDLLGWTPDGTALVFRSERSGTTDLWAVAMEDGRAVGEPVVVLREAPEDRGLGFTRSGDFYYRVRVGGIQGYLARLADRNGSRIAETVPTRRGRGVEVWSPDGEYLASVRSGRVAGDPPAILIRSATTGEERSWSLPGFERALARLSWSGDGRAVLVPTAGQRLALVRLDVQTGEVSEIVRDHFGVLSRDGKVFYYRERIRPGNSIIARDLETGAEQTLFTASDTQRIMTLDDLSPDGSRLVIALARRQAGPEGANEITWPLTSTIWSIGELALTGEYRNIVTLHAGTISDRACWTPDGESLLFVATDASAYLTPGGSTLWRVRVDGGLPTRLEFPAGARPIKGPGWELGCFHPDGTHFTYASDDVDTEIWIMEDLAGAVREALIDGNEDQED